ncbi:hypothetical protein DSO57_1004836 [Entomophthora muscae]|nr:hypothetical protein DSO57_1004836 [Entomophthora muscae]
MSMSLFDPSEQQYLSGFFDNLAEDKNEFILPTGFDFSTLLSSWNAPNFPDSQPKPQLQPYGLQPTPQHPYYHLPGTPHLSAPVSFHGPQSFSLPPEPHNAGIYLSPAIKYPQPCEQLSSLSDSSSGTPHCNINEQPANLAYSSVSFAPKGKPAAEPVQLSKKRPNALSRTNSEEDAKIPRLNKEPLKDDQRKANHIASEQKRRDIIRRGFESLSELVPGLKKTNCSKATILTRAADYMQEIEGKILELRKKKESIVAQLSGESSAPPALHRPLS